jgi:hypothetical protein
VTNFGRLMIALVCLGVTGSRPGWADPPQEREDVVRDPYEPHVTRGNTVRLGTTVGFLYGEPVPALGLGATFSVGQRFGRLAIEAEGALMTLEDPGGSNQTLGDGERLGVLARLDLVRFGPRYIGGNSLAAIYVEGGAAIAWNHWYTPAETEPSRIVPADTKRAEGQIGFGAMLEHRLQEPTGFPRRVGWFLGWRLGVSPAAVDTATVCRGSTCRVAEPMPDPSTARFTVRSMLFQSSLFATW